MEGNNSEHPISSVRRSQPESGLFKGRQPFFSVNILWQVEIVQGELQAGWGHLKDMT